MVADWLLKARPRVTGNYHRGSGAALAQATTDPGLQIKFTILKLGSILLGSSPQG